jgi:hypothetical protein
LYGFDKNDASIQFEVSYMLEDNLKIWRLIVHKLPTYKKRKVHFINQASHNDWRIKIYGISVSGKPLVEELVSNAVSHLLPKLPETAITDQRYGVGFLIIHQGTMRNWFLLDWWETEDIMHHLLFSSPLEESDAITAEPDTSLIACVHELRVINFESEAWIKTMLSNDKNSDIKAYMALRFSEQ